MSWSGRPFSTPSSSKSHRTRCERELFRWWSLIIGAGSCGSAGSIAGKLGGGDGPGHCKRFTRMWPWYRCRSAAVLIEHRDDNARFEAAKRADAMLAKGDVEGHGVWLKIVRAIDTLQHAKISAGPSPRHRLGCRPTEIPKPSLNRPRPRAAASAAAWHDAATPLGLLASSTRAESPARKTKGRVRG